MHHLRLRRPSTATIVSLIALFFAMSGTAVAATGGDFLLGKSNTATAVTSLSNSKGTALSLSSTATTPPLTVSNSVQVPNLNASQLDGQTASGFLGVNGTAANSSELGGIPASGYIQGGGTISYARLTLGSTVGQYDGTLIYGPDGDLIFAYCDSTSNYVEPQLQLVGPGTGGGGSAIWLNKDGSGSGNPNSNPYITPVSLSPYLVVLQVDTGSHISTYTLTQFAAGDTCLYTAQVVITNG